MKYPTTTPIITTTANPIVTITDADIVLGEIAFMPSNLALQPRAACGAFAARACWAAPAFNDLSDESWQPSASKFDGASQRWKLQRMRGHS